MQFINVTESKPQRLDFPRAFVGLRTITRVGPGDAVLFLKLDNGMQYRLFRCSEGGSASFRLILDQPVTLSLRGRGKATLTYTTVSKDAADSPDTASYLVERVEL